MGARYHQKIQDLQGQVAKCEESGEYGDTATTSSSTAAQSTKSSSASGTAEEKDGAVGAAASLRPRSLFSAPNPFRTVELLQRSGYSRFQSYGLLGLLYVAVFLLEMLLLYGGWKVWGQS